MGPRQPVSQRYTLGYCDLLLSGDELIIENLFTRATNVDFAYHWGCLHYGYSALNVFAVLYVHSPFQVVR